VELSIRRGLMPKFCRINPSFLNISEVQITCDATLQQTRKPEPIHEFRLGLAEQVQKVPSYDSSRDSPNTRSGGTRREREFDNFG